MTCTDRMAELVDCARGKTGQHTAPSPDLRAHLAECSRCAERWDTERRLTEEFGAMRLQATALAAPGPVPGVLMAQFAAMDFARRQKKSAARSWGLALAAAAAVVLAVFAGQIAGTRSHLHGTPALVTDAGPDAVEFSGDASELSSDDFLAVPYTPPLAQGELVRVVHADLAPEALASLGVDVDPAGSGEVAADLVVGEDGIPRAVRITDGSQN
jgi:hypothetical protein